MLNDPKVHHLKICLSGENFPVPWTVPTRPYRSANLLARLIALTTGRGFCNPALLFFITQGLNKKTHYIRFGKNHGWLSRLQVITHNSELRAFRGKHTHLQWQQAPWPSPPASPHPREPPGCPCASAAPSRSASRCLPRANRAWWQRQQANITTGIIQGIIIYERTWKTYIHLNLNICSFCYFKLARLS